MLHTGSELWLKLNTFVTLFAGIVKEKEEIATEKEEKETVIGTGIEIAIVNARGDAEVGHATVIVIETGREIVIETKIGK